MLSVVNNIELERTARTTVKDRSSVILVVMGVNLNVSHAIFDSVTH